MYISDFKYFTIRVNAYLLDIKGVWTSIIKYLTDFILCIVLKFEYLAITQKKKSKILGQFLARGTVISSFQLVFG